jgi:putative sigma-54 modulation protein
MYITNKTKKRGEIFMQIKITGKELKVTEAINDYVERKMERIAKYFEDAEADVVIRVEKNVQIAEMRVSANGEMFRAVTEDKDLYASIDKDIDILEGQIRKAKTKKERMLKDSTLKVLEVEAPVQEVADEILKTAYYEIKPMTPEDAKLKLQERPTQMFLTFVNVETGKVNVIHRLKDNKNYGLIEPEA